MTPKYLKVYSLEYSYIKFNSFINLNIYQNYRLQHFIIIIGENQIYSKNKFIKLFFLLFVLVSNLKIKSNLFQWF